MEECLSSIYSQNFNDFEVILVDNDSRDGSLEFLASRFPQVTVVRSGSNLGFAGGNNFGLPHCRGEYVFFLNNDTRLESNCLENLAAGLRAYPRSRVFACFMLSYREPSIVDNAGENFYRNGILCTFAGYPAEKFTAPREVNGACAGAAVYAKSLLNEIGAFDEDFFLVYEDTDLSLRARHHGEKIMFLPDARVYHKGSASLGGAFSATTVYFSTRNFFWFLLKNFPTVTILKCTPGLLFTLVYRFFQVARRGKLRTYFRAYKDSLKRIPLMLKKRRKILSDSRITRAEFERLFREGWLRERLAIKKGSYNFPP